MFNARVSIPSREGRYKKNLSCIDPLSPTIDDRNKLTFISLIICWTALLADSPLGDLKPNRVINKFVSLLISDPIGLIDHYARIADDVSRTFTHSSSSEEHPVGMFTKEMMDTPIFREYLHFYRTSDPRCLQYILTFLLFGKKVSYIDASLNTTALRGWREVEEKLSQLRLNPVLMKNLYRVIDMFFKEWEADVFLPRHGPGAVSEEKIHGIFGKNRNFPYMKKIDMIYNRSVFFYNETLPIFPSPVSEEGPRSRQYSRLMFVPKDCKKSRSICMEPIILQWAQQGVRLWYEESLSKSILKNHVFLKDQTENQYAAIFGSKTGRVDTIDLSSASDSVAWELVKNIFPSKVLKHLAATRSSIVELPDGTLFPVRKFAPMGSALCFPVQSTIYSAIVFLCGICYRYGVSPFDDLFPSNADLYDLYLKTFRTVLFQTVSRSDHRLDPFFVYGDDIICDTRITSSVIDLLRELGFKVNEEKSYSHNVAFRESCGIYSFKGEDVTPLRFKIKSLTQRMNMDTLAGFIDLANRAYDYGYMNLRSHLLRYIMCYPLDTHHMSNKQGINPILFSRDRDISFSIFTDNPRNGHLKTRSPLDSDSKGTHVDFQRAEIRHLSVGPRVVKRLTILDDNYRFTQWQRSHYHRLETHSTEWEPMVSETRKTGFRWLWTAI